jgi:glyoxylase-like metal-dependent hydrolase (beta-lactamase superfamily II)
MKKSTSRRNFLKLTGLTGAAAMVSLATTSQAPKARAAALQPAGMQGHITIVPTAVGNIHTYTAPEMGARVTTHIIETESGLLLVDGQFLSPFGAEAAAYAASLGKPIDRVILTHDHPDHWYGAEHFDAPLVATATTAALVEEAVSSGAAEANGANFGDAGPSAFRTAEAAITLGTDTILGVNIEFSAYENAEAVENLVMLLPDAKVAILQDMMYNGVYFFPGVDRQNWIAGLDDIRTKLLADGYETVLVGHGVPTTVGVLDNGIEFLTFLDEQFNTAETGDAILQAVLERYPSYQGLPLTAFYALFFDGTTTE